MATLRERYEEVFIWKDEGKGWGIPTDDDVDDCARRGEFKLSCQVDFRDGLSYMSRRSLQILVVVGKLAIKATFGSHLLNKHLTNVPLVTFKCKTTGETLDLKLYRLRLSPMTAVLEYRPQNPEDVSTTYLEDGSTDLDWESFALCQADCRFDGSDSDIEEYACPFLIKKFKEWIELKWDIGIEKPHVDLIRELDNYCIATLCAVNPCEGQDEDATCYYKLLKLRGRVMWERFEGTMSFFTGWMYDLASDVSRDVISEMELIKLVRPIIRSHAELDNRNVFKRLFLGGEFVDLSGYGTWVEDVHSFRSLPNSEKKQIMLPNFVFRNRPELGNQSRVGRAFVENAEKFQPMIVGKEAIFPSCRVGFRKSLCVALPDTPAYVPGDTVEEESVDPRCLVDETGKVVGKNHARNVRQREKRRQRKLKEASSATHASAPDGVHSQIPEAIAGGCN